MCVCEGGGEGLSEEGAGGHSTQAPAFQTRKFSLMSLGV